MMHPHSLNAFFRSVMPLCLLLAGTSASAQTNMGYVVDVSAGDRLTLHAAYVTEADPIDVIDWKQAELRGGLSARRLIGTKVQGKQGKSIGEVADIVVSAKDRIESIIVDSGGLLGLGELRFTVPWEKVTLGPKLEYARVPLKENRVPNFDHAGAEKPRTGPRAWRVSELVGDFVKLSDGRRYGIADDLLFDRDGNIRAIVVTPAVGHGRYGRFAYPYHGFNYGFDPGSASYTIPYRENEIMNLLPFEYEAMDILGPKPRSP